jgi:16S rRNA (guanine527-N7)-methyltransferase
MNQLAIWNWYNPVMESDLQILFTENGFHLAPNQLRAFKIFEDELLLWNDKFNLTAIRDREDIRVKHFLDSVTCLKAVPSLHSQKVIDIGTGAGFPGIPLKILCPGISLTLVESIGKKAAFCQHMIEVLELKNVNVVVQRAEEIGKLPAHHEKYDLALARAVAILPILSEYLLPLVKVGGKMVVQKGESAPAECQQAEHAIKILGGCLEQLIPIQLPGVPGDRYLVVIKKISTTPNGYPRNTGIPQKKPL